MAYHLLTPNWLITEKLLVCYDYLTFPQRSLSHVHLIWGENTEEAVLRRNVINMIGAFLLLEGWSSPDVDIPIRHLLTHSDQSHSSIFYGKENKQNRYCIFCIRLFSNHTNQSSRWVEFASSAYYAMDGRFHTRESGVILLFKTDLKFPLLNKSSHNVAWFV